MQTVANSAHKRDFVLYVRPETTRLQSKKVVGDSPMRLLSKVLESRILLAVIVLVVLLGAGTGAFLIGRNTAQVNASSAHVNAGPASGTASELQVIMGNPETVAADDATASDGSSTDAAGGTEGPAGADGAAGLDGVAGLDGAAGTDGLAGADGAEGPAGPEGPAGSVGATGPAGSVGATGPAGPGLTAVTTNGGGFELQSPDGVSYRIHVTNAGIVFSGPNSTQTWSDTSRFQSLLPN
jgi:hypothetical protein